VWQLLMDGLCVAKSPGWSAARPVPQQSPMFCEFPEAARTSRKWMLNYVVKSGAVYFSSHFPIHPLDASREIKGSTNGIMFE
jgi:hypothetical protein